MSSPGTDPDESERLRAELQQVRKERDGLVARVLELEQQLAAPARPASAGPRAAFEDSFRVEQARAKRQRTALSLVLIELDNVQGLRDRYGHAAGEEVLLHLARHLERALRPTDVLARVDALAHAVLLPETGLEQALAAMLRIQRELSGAPIPTSGGPVAPTIRAGVVQWRNDERLGDALARASRALGLAHCGGPRGIVSG